MQCGEYAAIVINDKNVSGFLHGRTMSCYICEGKYILFSRERRERRGIIRGLFHWALLPGKTHGCFFIRSGSNKSSSRRGAALRSASGYMPYHDKVGVIPRHGRCCTTAGTCRTIARYFLYHRGIHFVPLQDTAGNLAVTVISLERHVLQQL